MTYAKDKDKSKFTPTLEKPADEKFLINFKEKGGKFLYCEDQEEIFSTFGEILSENNWEAARVCCFDKNLRSKFSDFNIDFTKSQRAEFCLLSCEYLIGDTGAILMSSNQIKEKKLKDLPYNLVVLAGTSQLIETVDEGLQGINRQKRLPSNITTLKNFGKISETEGHFLNYGNVTKNLYLLLLEDL